ncbi:MAG: PhzF family phenazine biosynthesis protein [Rhodoferax sp.]|uniref:PhzF family phenazine biosynthesis protein n=1 Tax=Rhodoferax sp. TaxID=50421 RepID=UPI0026223D20|nr:PhzF family phenazine biosynthesis protein [Rhodoferax sp.]MDD5334350.1 PhzF family phenazine biosynthesis protein [Rhodoferax sp.]
MRTRPFKQVDVFTAAPYLGNPLAVVLDGTDLSDQEMQAFARWTNLSETTFLLPPSDAGAAAGADYCVRIFTPGGELPFAGHPTLGTCHAWLQAGRKIGGEIPGQDNSVSGATNSTAKRGSDRQSFVQECKVGLIRIRRQGTGLAFAAPPLQRSNPGPALLAKVAAALGLKASQIVAAQLLDNGPQWLGLLLDSPQTVLQLVPNHLELKNLGQKVGVASVQAAAPAAALIARSNREARAFGPRSSEPAGIAESEVEVEVRAFAAPIGVNEDPVTGSFNASLAQWLIADGFAPRTYVAAQGSCLGRAGRVHIAQDDAGQVWVGGDCVTCIDGQVAL